MNTRYPFHALQWFGCLKEGPGKRSYIAARASEDFSIPSAILDIHDGIVPAPILKMIPDDSVWLSVQQEKGQRSNDST